MTPGVAVDLATLRAVLDRIIPRDTFPSACDSGVDRFILALWAAGSEPSEQLVAAGLAALDRASTERNGTRFAALSPEWQDALLARIETAHWFARLCEVAAEGYYADPGNGANPGAISWRMIGYRHGLPDGPDGPAWDARDIRPGVLWR